MLNKSVLVTGANSLLGTHLCKELLSDGRRVIGMVRKTSNTTSLDALIKNEKFSIRIGDVRSREDLNNACLGATDIFHCAAVFSYFGYDKKGMYATAQEGSENLISAARKAGVEKITLTSTTALLGGDKHATPKCEKATADLSSYPDYFKSKALQEKAMIDAAKSASLPLYIANPSLFLGPYDEKPSSSLATLTGYIEAPLRLTYPGGVCISHAQDIARGHILISKKAEPYERYILCGENLKWRELHQLISELLGLKGPQLCVGRKTAWLGGAMMEMGAKLTGKPPLGTRELSQQVGSYFWYDGTKAKILGYKSRSSRETVADVLGWLMATKRFVSRQQELSSDLQDRIEHWLGEAS